MATRYVQISKFCELTGYTERAVETKIHRGIWVEGRQYRRAPDGRLLIDMEGFEKWVENQPEAAYAPTATA